MQPIDSFGRDVVDGGDDVVGGWLAGRDAAVCHCFRVECGRVSCIMQTRGVHMQLTVLAINKGTLPLFFPHPQLSVSPNKLTHTQIKVWNSA
jgi:hypothetical protein